MTKKNWVFLFRSAPAEGDRAKEGLDALLAAAAFEQHALPVFLHQGVWQLQTNMALNLIHLPNIEKQLTALPLYDVEKLYVHQASFDSASVETDHKNIEWINDQELKAIIAQADQVFTF